MNNRGNDIRQKGDGGESEVWSRLDGFWASLTSLRIAANAGRPNCGQMGVKYKQKIWGKDPGQYGTGREKVMGLGM